MIEVDERFEHVAVFHGGVDALAEQVEVSIADRIADDDAVLVSLDAPSSDAVCAVLSRRGRPATRLDAPVRYARPAGAMRMAHDFTRRAIDEGAARVWSIGRIDFAHEDGRWARYEAAVDDVLGHLPFVGVCAYDTSVLDDAVLDTALRTHRHVQGPGVEPRPSPAYAPASFRRPSHSWIPTEPPAIELPASDLAAGRTAVTSLGESAGLPADRLLDMQVVVSELATNAIVHGAVPSTVRAWRSGSRVVIQVVDHGPGLPDPWPDLRPPRAGRVGGYGLWIVGQLADRFDLDRRADGTTVLAAAFEAA